jgi:small subunit ribosomal protein S20
LAISSSAAKQRRQSLKRRLRNKSVESEVKTIVTRARKAISTGGEGAKEAVVTAQSALDKAAEKGIIHKNNAARRKSRLALRLKTAAKPAAKPSAKKKKA